MKVTPAFLRFVILPLFNSVHSFTGTGLAATGEMHISSSIGEWLTLTQQANTKPADLLRNKVDVFRKNAKTSCFGG